MMENCPSSNLPGYGPALLIKRPVRTRMQGVVGAGGEKPPATRLGHFNEKKIDKTLNLRVDNLYAKYYIYKSRHIIFNP